MPAIQPDYERYLRECEAEGAIPARFETWQRTANPLCSTCAQRHPNMGDEVSDDQGCDWDNFPGFGWRDKMHKEGWILHEDNQTGEAVWLKELMFGQWQERGNHLNRPYLPMIWTAEEYPFLFTKVMPEYEL